MKTAEGAKTSLYRHVHGHHSTPGGVICQELVLRSAVASKLLERIDFTLYPKMSADAEWKQKLISDLFRRSHEFMGLHPRSETLSFLDQLHQRWGVAIVSNTNRQLLRTRLRRLGVTHSINVVGQARKFVVDDEWATVPETFQPESFPRPVFLRRSYYGRVLEDLASAGFRPDRTAVIGDIWELDLALPEFLGYTTIQLLTEGTPSYEVERKRPPKSFLVHSLMGAYERLCDSDM